jgi:hypothetical protein
MCINQLNAFLGVATLGTFLALLYYAFLTLKIAEGTEENTKVNKANLANIYPGFFFDEEGKNSQEGKLAKGKQGEFYIFSFFIVNPRLVTGRFRLDFEFGVRKNEKFVHTDDYIFEEEVFKPGNERSYPIQPGETMSFGLRIIPKKLIAWVSKAYQQLEGIENIDEFLNEFFPIPEEDKDTIEKRTDLYINIKLLGKPHPSTKSNEIYRFDKLYYIKLAGREPLNWRIIGEPTVDYPESR